MEKVTGLDYVQKVFRRKWLDDPDAIEEWKHLKETTTKETIDQAAHLVYAEFANQGDAVAMNCLAIDFGLGEGCEKDTEKEKYWSLKAANAGNVSAILRMGRHYSLGDVVEKNDDEAIKWYIKGVEMGSVECQVELAEMYIVSKVRNIGKAIELLVSAASKGDVEAMYRLGNLYDNLSSGLEVYDEDKAIYWYDAAARNGNKYAAEMRDILKKSIEKHGYIGVNKNGFLREDWMDISSERLEEQLKVMKRQCADIGM